MIDIHNIGQEQAGILKRAYQKKQLAHSYLFVDKDETRALNTAYWLACLYNCLGDNKPDGDCRNCRQIISQNHPDVLLVQPEGKQTLGIDQIRPLKEELAKSPVESTNRFFFINQAQKLTLNAANALLNLLEEPIAPVVSILITNNADQILPTVRSRTQIINFTDAASATGKTAELLENGFTPDEVNELKSSDKLEQEVKYFYEEIIEQNNLAIVSAHKLADEAKLVSQQNYILFLLKKLAQKDLEQDSSVRMLECLIEVDKMRFSNVNFRNVLDYLVLVQER